MRSRLRNFIYAEIETSTRILGILHHIHPKREKVEKEEWQKFIARERKVVEGLMEVFAN